MNCGVPKGRGPSGKGRFEQRGLINKIMCRGCGMDIIRFFSLGRMPLVNRFLKEAEISQERKYDLTVGFCPNCYLTQLAQTVAPEELFSEYLYFSSTSSSFLEHCRKTAQYFLQRFNLSQQSLVLEIASNDGAQLQYFREFGVQVLGIDPAKNIANVANKKGIKTIPEFFNQVFAQKLRKEGIEADLVFGANVLAHVPEIIDFIKGVKIVLKSRGTAVFEFPYIRGLIENKFDTIYHEHVFYYSLIALQNLFKKVDLEIYDVEMTPAQGGSLRIFVSHPSVFPVSESVRRLTRQELADDFDKIETYYKIGERVSWLKRDLISLLDGIKDGGQGIAAYSAPAKGNILLNYFRIKDYLSFIVDKSEAKQGLYTPGTHLLVYPLKKIYEEKPDYLLILCWNIAEEIINMPELQEYKKQGGKFIIPVPAVQVI